MDSNMKDLLQKEFNKIQAPKSLFDFAYEVPDLVENEGRKKNMKKKGFKKMIYSATAAIACSALFAFGVNLSPTFATYVEKIPVLAQISEFILGVDKAADNGFMELVDYSTTDQNIKFTIDNVITDSKRTILLYHATVDSDYSNIKSLILANYTIKNENGDIITQRKDGSFIKNGENSFSSRWTLSPGEVESTDSSKLVGMIELVSQDGTASTPKEILFSIDRFELIDSEGQLIKEVDGTWNVNIPLNSDHITVKPVEYGKQPFSIEIGNQKLDLLINYTKVYPTMTEISIDLITEINKGIYYKYHLEDEAGNVYKYIDDAFMTDSGDVLSQFETSYFSNVKELYLVITSVSTSKRVNNSFEDETFTVNQKIKLNK